MRPRSSSTAPAPRPRTAPLRPRRASNAGSTLLGVFIGLVLGILIAAAAALYVTGGWKAYQQQFGAQGTPRAPAGKEAPKNAKAEPEKPRFDFYKILPGGEEPKVAQPAKPVPPDRAMADRAAERSSGKAADSADAPSGSTRPAEPRAPDKTASVDPSPKASDRFWLQAGSFAAEADAENLKARLALAGWEAQVQQGTVADKGVRYRVRLGPYDNTDELNRIKGELAKRGFDVAVIRQ
jgi:cell division protein FtsN